MSTNHTTPKRDKSGRIVCTVAFTKEQTAPAEEGALKKIGSSIKIEGFRPGKVPLEMIREKVNPDQLLEETIRALLPGTIQKLAEENGVKPIIPPKIETQSREPLTLQITFVEHPKVTVKNADKIKAEKKETKVSDKDVQRAIDYILEQHQKTMEVERAAKDGDRITMDFHGEDEDGKEIEGTRTKGHEVIVGSKTLIPGFEEELLGLSKDDRKTFTLKFPEKYHAAHLQGKPVTFHVIVTKVEEITKPKLTDAFAQEHLNASSVRDFKNYIQQSMEEQERRIEHQRREAELLEKIRKATEVELAPELIEEEERGIVENFSGQLKEKNITFEDWLKQAKKKPEEVKKDIHRQAKDKLILRLGIQHLAGEKGIDLTDKEMEEAVTGLLASLSTDERARIEPAYQKGYQGWHQLKWQKRVEKLIEQMLE